MSGPRERRQVLYEGRVQGVGFRYTTRSIATSFEVAGFVKNLPDGRVQLVVEGMCAEVSKFLDEINDRLGHFVRDAHVSSSEATGEFSSFNIAF